MGQFCHVVYFQHLGQLIFILNKERQALGTRLAYEAAVSETIGFSSAAQLGWDQ